MSSKSQEKPALRPEWWLKIRPEGVGETDLVRALKGAEKALELWENDPEAGRLEETLQALGRVARELKETRRSLKDREYAGVRDRLEEAEELAEAERGRITTEAAELDDDPPEDTPGDRLADPDYLHKLFRKLPRKGPACFSFASSPEPEECRLFARLRGEPRRLLGFAREVHGDGKPCCGRIHIAVEDPRTLLVSVDTVVPSRLAFSLRRYLRTQGIGRIKKVLVLKDGQMVHASNEDEDANDAEDFTGAAAAAYAAGLSREAPERLTAQQEAVKAALREWKNARSQASLEVVAARGHAARPLTEQETHALEQALERRDQTLRAAVESLLRTSLDRADARATLLARVKQEAGDYLNFIATDGWLKAVDRTVVPDVSMRAPLVKALARLLEAVEG